MVKYDCKLQRKHVSEQKDNSRHPDM